jgi:sugar lactone lactonase YvrE
MVVFVKRVIYSLCAFGVLCGAAESLRSQTFVFSTLAGNAGYGCADGLTNQARFDFPQGVTADNAGNIYVADTENSTIRKIDPAGNVTTLAGMPDVNGKSDGTGSEALFSNPQGLAVDANGNVYVADTGNQTIRKINPAGVVTTLAGAAGRSGASNGVNGGILFNLPGAVAVDAAGVLYVADTHNSAIRMLTQVGTNWVGTTIAGLTNVVGNQDGTNTSARFYWPSGIAVDTNRNLFVADTGNNAIRKITRSRTNWVTTTLVAVGVPGGVSVDLAGNVFASAPGDNTIRKITMTGTNWAQRTWAGIAGLAGSVDGSNAATFNEPLGLTALTNGVVIVADSLNNTIRRITPAGVVSTVAGAAGGSGSKDGSRSQARFSGPMGIAVDSTTNAYVADTQNNCIRRITPAGIVTTVAGTPGNPAGSADGLGTNASFRLPTAVAVDANSNIYVADFANNEIRKVAPASGNWAVTTLAGRAGTVYAGPVTNVFGGATNSSTVVSETPLYTNYSGGTNIFILPPAPPHLDGVGTNALFHHPCALSIDNAGNLYVTENDTNGVRVIGPDGTVTTLPGSVGAYSVSPVLFGTNQLAYSSSSAVVDGAGGIYVSDAGNNTIRKISPGGQVTAIAGSPGLFGTADGTNDQARFAAPVSLALYDQTNLLVADSLSHTIRMIVPAGSNWVVTTIGGKAGVQGSTDGSGSDARFNNPSGIALDPAGNLYVADTDNDTIRFGQIGAAPPVSLQIAEVAGQVVLSWPSSAVGYVLENASSVSGNVWSPVTNVPMISGNYWVVTNDTSAAAAFYRLYKP